MHKEWARECIQKADKKLLKVMERNEGIIPYTSENGRFTDKFASDKYWWANGFWAGLLWLMYERTGNPAYCDCAAKQEAMLDEALYGDTMEGLHHDVGFMWLHTSAACYKLTGNEASRRRALTAANLLLSRYNPSGGYLVAWNGTNRQGWSIIDSMMNIPLLYWASEETGYERFRTAAKAHADKTLEHVLRPDGSVIHIIEYDHQSGEVLGSFGGQGFAEGSSWTRGQAWAIYGFALSYRHTREEKYLLAAKKVAHYFLSSLTPDLVPAVDFRSPPEPAYKDTSAGAIAACGLLEIAGHVGEYEAAQYHDRAVGILKALEKDYCCWDSTTDPLLSHGTEAYHDPGKKHISLIYGDYFFIEGLARLSGMDFCMW